MTETGGYQPPEAVLHTFPEKNPEQQLAVEFSSNAAVERLVDAFQTTPLDWERISQDLQARGIYKIGKNMYGKHLKGAIFEAHIRATLHDLVTSQDQDRQEGIFPHPINNQTLSDTYRFFLVDAGNIHAIFKQSSGGAAEYDAAVRAVAGDSKLLVIIDGKSVDLERSFGDSPQQQKKARQVREGFERTFKPETINKSFRPIQDAMQHIPTDVVNGLSYVIVVPQDVYNPEKYAWQRTFIEQYKGRIVGVPLTGSELSRQMLAKMPPTKNLQRRVFNLQG